MWSPDNENISEGGEDGVGGDVEGGDDLGVEGAWKDGSGVIAKPVPIPFPTLSQDRVILVITITITITILVTTSTILITT